METLTQIFTVNLNEVPVMSTDRHISRKEQAKMTRDLFKRLGIKGVSVTKPNYSMAQTVDVKIPFDLTPDDYEFNGKNYSSKCFSDMPEGTPAKTKSKTRWNARTRLLEILNKAFPCHDDRSDHQSDYFDYKWSVD